MTSITQELIRALHTEAINARMACDPKNINQFQAGIRWTNQARPDTDAALKAYRAQQQYFQLMGLDEVFAA